MSKTQIINASCSRRGLEIEQVKRFLEGNGHSLARDDWNVDPDADLILLFTCGFTEAAEDFGFETLRRAQTAKKRGARVIFGGCIPEIDPDRVMREYDGPTFSPQSYSRLNELLGAERRFEEFRRPNTFQNSYAFSLAKDFRQAIEILKLFDGSFSGLDHLYRRLSNSVRRRVIGKKYANLSSNETFYIQIQEGCSMRCSYCAIRTAIGPLRSRPMKTVLSEFEDGLAKGFRRYQLTGDNAGSYGLDQGVNMRKLLEHILDFDQDFSLDLTDINPVYLPLIFEPMSKLCVQKKLSSLYMPIQSGSRPMLKLMGRDCDMKSVKEMLIQVRKLAPPGFKMGTSLIVGFPSEAIEDVEVTIQYCRDVRFDWIWCHSFSARPGTPAAALPGQISAEEILHRVRLTKSRIGSRSSVITAEDKSGNKTCQG